MDETYKYLFFVNEENKASMHAPVPQNVLYYFELNNWFANDAFRSFSVKLVLDGVINYRIGNTIYPVKKDQVLIGNKQPDVQSYFDSQKPVRSVCLNISMDTIAEAYTVMMKRDKLNLENLRAGYFKQPDFPERTFNVRHNELLSPFHQVALQLESHKNEEDYINEEFFLIMGEKIVCQLYETAKTFNNLECTRTTTKKEILRRLDIAKNYLEENFLDCPSVTDIARHCNMSDFHFFRSFRQAFDITPYQLQLKLRLDYAKRLIIDSDLSLTEIAKKCSFPDLATFSKAYKRTYQALPSRLRTRN